MKTEIIDDPELPAADLAMALRDLARVNRILQAQRPGLRFLERAIRSLPRRVGSIRILDAGSGYGDHLRAIARMAERLRVPVELTGVDIAPAAVAAATAATPEEMPIRFIASDIFDYCPEPPPDFVVSSLFAHHLPRPAVPRFIGWMEEHARMGWHLDDLHRHRVALLGFRLLGAAVRLHPIVRHDGAVSVMRGFTRGEWEGHVHEAGLDGEVEIRWSFPFRFTLSRMREGTAGKGPC